MVEGALPPTFFQITSSLPMHQTSILWQDVANSKHSKGFTEPYKYKWMASSLKKVILWVEGGERQHVFTYSRLSLPGVDHANT